jgi:hypothetical protein
LIAPITQHVRCSKNLIHAVALVILDIYAFKMHLTSFLS